MVPVHVPGFDRQPPRRKNAGAVCIGMNSDKIAGDKAEDAAGLTPGKDDNVISSYFRR